MPSAECALLFDFDGVIAQTLEDNYQAWVAVFRRYQVKLESQEYFLNEGLSSAAMVPLVLQRNGLPLDLAPLIIAEKVAHYAANHNFSLYPGTTALLTALQTAEVKTALVSGGSPERLLKPPSAQVQPFFTEIITAADSPSPKPDPAPFLEAARRLGVNPRQCIAIENAPLGIQAAKAAGMQCLAISSTLPADQLRQADQIFTDIVELHQALAGELGIAGPARPND